MQLTRTSLTSGIRTSITVAGERHEVLFTSSKTFLVFREGDREGCCFEIIEAGRRVIVAHHHDVHLETGEIVPRTEYCKVRGAKSYVSPHAEAAKKFQGILEADLVQPALLTGSGGDAPRRKPLPRPGGRNRCRNCGAQNPGDPCFNCDYSPSRDE